jgi:hypothetical protein
MKLELDPLVNARPSDAFHVARSRAEGQPVQGMDGLFLFIHCPSRGLGFFSAQGKVDWESGSRQGSGHHQPPVSSQRHLHADRPHENEPELQEKLPASTQPV